MRTLTEISEPEPTPRFQEAACISFLEIFPCSHRTPRPDATQPPEPHRGIAPSTILFVIELA